MFAVADVVSRVSDADRAGRWLLLKAGSSAMLTL